MKKLPAHYMIGSSYYPEQWAKDRWEEDFSKMKHLGHNAVRMGEFAWAFFEPRKGEFHFDWMDQAIEIAGRYGLGVVLCTPTASVPPWLRKAHPDVLGGNENGPYIYGGRKAYCVNSDSLQAASDRIVTAVSKHYAANPNVIGWQLDNEPGHPFVCYDANCERAFRLWLKNKYGAIEALNEAWDGAFWSNNYGGFDEVELGANKCEGGWHPGIRLDYRRFFSDSFSIYLRRQLAIVQKHSGDRFITTNWPNANWSVDVYEMGAHLDAASWDNYPSAPGVSDWHDQYYSGRNHDMCRCSNPHGQFFTAEQSTQVPAHAMTEGIRLQTYINLAHGASGQIFFEWRPPTGGAEQGYISVLQMDGSYGPAYEQHRRIGSEMARLGPMLTGAQTQSDIALVWCFDNQWNKGFWCGENGYDVELDRYYAGLKSLRRNIDVISIAADFSPYRILAAPLLAILSDQLAARLDGFVRDGGTLMLGASSGTKDVHNRIRESVAPGVFSELAGLLIPHSVSKTAMAGQLMLGAEERNIDEELAILFSGDSVAYRPRTVLEGIRTNGAEAVAFFRGGRMTGRPAVTVNRVGKGHVVYVGTDSEDIAFYERIAKLLGDLSKMPPLIDAPPGVEVTSRVKDGKTYFFCLNLTEQTKTIPLPSPMEEHVTGQIVEGEMLMGPLDVLVLSAKQNAK